MKTEHASGRVKEQADDTSYQVQVMTDLPFSTRGSARKSFPSPMGRAKGTLAPGRTEKKTLPDQP